MNRIAYITATTGGKLLGGFWLLALAILVGFPIVGFLQGDFLGYLAFSILPGGILLDVSIVVAYLVRHGSEKIAKAAWVILCIADLVLFCLLNATYPQPAGASKETELILAYTMLTLSFPAGFLGVFVLYTASFGFDFLFAESGSTNFGVTGFYISNFLGWVFLFICGYVQWFKLLPWFIEKWRARRASQA